MEFKNRTVDIFGTKWNIKFVDKVFLLDKNDEESLVWGEADHINKIIKVALHTLEGKDIPKEDVILTIYHELMHVIFGEGKYFNSNNDEPLVEWCAKCIRSLIRQKVL